MKRFGFPRRPVCRAVFTAFCLLLAPSIGGAFAQEQTALPGGASSLRETYQEWLVACVQENTKRCALSQQQTQENGNRVLAIEIVASPDGTATGVLVLPFGLALDAGVTLQVDDKPAEAPLRFSTCLSGGCLVPLSFDEALLSALRVGETLKLTAEAADSGQAISLSVSLKGFSAAFDRVGALMN